MKWCIDRTQRLGVNRQTKIVTNSLVEVSEISQVVGQIVSVWCRLLTD